MKYFLIFILSINFLVATATNSNRYINSEVSQDYKGDLINFIQSLYKDSSERLIKYEISFVNKQNEPPLVSSIEINSHIDTEKNILFEAIKITYLPKRGHYYEAALKGQEIDFQINPFATKNDDITIVDINSPGWRINKHDKYARLTSLYDTLFNNTIHFVLIVKNQNRYKRRIIDFYNLYGIDFYCKMHIDSNYNFTGYFPNLPFPSIDLPDRINDIYNPFGTSISKQIQVQNNKILYQGYFVSDINYSDDLKFYRNPPKTHMQFSYGYDLTRNTNQVIIEENKLSTKQTLNEIISSSRSSTMIALILFALSIMVSILFYLNPRGSKFNQKIIEYYRTIANWINLLLSNMKRLSRFRITKKNDKEL